MYFRLAWRNIWRNKRRTLITMASVFFAVVLSTFMMSMKEGVYSGMIDSVVGSYSGYGQVHARDYWEEKILDYSFGFNEEFASKVRNTSGISQIQERIEGVAMAISGDLTKVAMISGINVKGEAEYNGLNKRVINGAYLHPEDKSVLIGSGLSDYLKLKVHDTLILLGQGYHGAAAAGKYPVKGIVKFGSPELSKQLVFLPFKEAQWFFGMEGMANNLILHFNDDNREKTIRELRNKLGTEYEVMGWEEVMPEVKNMIETDRAEGYVLMFVLYMVVSFGIFGTLLMMLAERTKEFGVLVSVGMKRIRLSIMVWMEVVLISFAGALLGILGAVPVCWYFHVHPIRLGKELEKMMEEYGMEAMLKTSVEPSIFVQQAAVILVIACVISVYPFVKLLRLNAIQAMRS